jgi:hypothetical protein
MDLPEQDRAARERGERLRAGGYAVSARYDARLGEVVVRLSTGLGLLITPAETEGLAGAGAADLSEIEITPSGLGLHWPRLDADVYIPALLEGVAGSRAWMAARLGENGGRAKSARKAAAAKENGRRGGRPRKAG